MKKAFWIVPAALAAAAVFPVSSVHAMTSVISVNNIGHTFTYFVGTNDFSCLYDMKEDGPYLAQLTYSYNAVYTYPSGAYDPARNGSHPVFPLKDGNYEIITGNCGVGLTRVQAERESTGISHFFIGLPHVSLLSQYLPDGKTALPEEAYSPRGPFVFRGIPRATSTDPTELPVSSTDMFSLEIEVRKYADSFVGVPVATSTSVAEGEYATIAIRDPEDGRYHWQARSRDLNTDEVSEWQEFGRKGNFDFGVGSEPTSGTVLFQNISPIIGEIPCSVHGCAPLPLRAVSSTPTTTLYLYSRIGFYGWCDPPVLGAYRDGALTQLVASWDPAVMWSSPTSTFPCNGDTSQSGNIAIQYDGVRLEGDLFYGLTASAGDVSRSIGIPYTDPVTHAAYYRLTDYLPWAFTPPPEHAKREPIVIIPGIMGAHLRRVSDGVEAWPNPDKMFSLLDLHDTYLDDLRMDVAGHGTVPLATGDIIRDLQFLFFKQSFYGNLIKSFIKDGYVEGKDLFIAPYDWRTDIGEAALTLAEIVARAAKISPTGKVSLIAHSMGGLVAEEYLAGNAGAAPVNKVVAIGVPQLGAPKDFAVLTEGDHLMLDWLGNFGVNSQEIKAIARNMPSVYELLPSRAYLKANGSYVRDRRAGADRMLDYEDIGKMLPNAELVTRAGAFHGVLDGKGINASNTYSIIGCLAPTLSGFVLRDRGDIDVTRSTGDGTVPVPGAMVAADPQRSYFILANETGIDHNGLINDPRSIEVIHAIIGDTTSTAFPSMGISRDAGDCITPRSGSGHVLTTVEFSTHSPVALHVYDAAGRHTGPSVAGAIEVGIPGSTYETVGENSFALVPAGAAYKVISEAFATGTFRMAVRGYNTVSPDERLFAEYVSVPLATASATARLDFSGFDGDMALKVDANGDGSTEAVVYPETEEPVTSTTTFVSLADTFIDHGAGNMNFGTSPELRIGGVWKDRVLVGFDGTDIRKTLANAKILSAQLVFNVIPDAGRTGKASSVAAALFRVPSPWSETEATWQCPNGTGKRPRWQPCKGGGWHWVDDHPFRETAVASTTVSGVSASISFDVTKEVVAMAAGAMTGNGWMAALRDNKKVIRFASRESGNGPVLVVRYAMMQEIR